MREQRGAGAGETTKGYGLGRGRVNGRRYALRQPAVVFGVAAVLVLLSTGAAAQVYRGDGDVYRVDAGSLIPQTSYLSADVTNNTLAPAASGLSMNVEAGGKYTFGCALFARNPIPNNGMTIDFGGGSAAATMFRASAMFTDTTPATTNASLETLAATGTATAFKGGVVGEGSATGIVRVSGSIEAATTGTIVPRFARGSSTGFPTVVYSVNSLAVAPSDPSTLYASTGTSPAYFWKSTDAGDSWTTRHIGAPYPITGVSAVAVDPTTLTTVYAHGMCPLSSTPACDRFSKSTDGGVTWLTSVGAGISGSAFTGIFVDPTTPTTIYGTITNAGARYASKSTDGGVNWVTITNGFGGTGGLQASFAIDPVDTATLYTSMNQTNALYKSTDGGANWALSNTGLSVGVSPVMAVDPATHTTVYAGGPMANAFYKSTDSGATWTSSNTGRVGGAVVAIGTDPSASPPIIYLGTASNPYVEKSTDGGASWSGATAVPGAAATVAMKVATNGTVYVAQNGAGLVYRSSDHGATWTKIAGSTVSLYKGSSCTLTRIR